jgi:hypothetical protein
LKPISTSQSSARLGSLFHRLPVLLLLVEVKRTYL